MDLIAVSVLLPVFNRGKAELTRASANLEWSDVERGAATLEFEEALAPARVTENDLDTTLSHTRATVRPPVECAVPGAGTLQFQTHVQFFRDCR